LYFTLSVPLCKDRAIKLLIVVHFKSCGGFICLESWRTEFNIFDRALTISSLD
jgi:hypothetical protein